MSLLARLLGRWPTALAAVAALAIVALLPGLGSFGLWDPQERQAADRAAPHRTGTVAELDTIVHGAVQAAVVIANQTLAGRPPPAPPPPGCQKTAPAGAVARSLSPRLIEWADDTIDDSDAARRLPFALLGILAVLATAGIAMRMIGPRAGVVVGLVALSMPLLALQARQLTSEIGTPAGGALIVYGLVALGGSRKLLPGIVDAVVAALALCGGIALGFCGGGALLGLVVPIGAYAAANALGIPLIVGTRIDGAQIKALFATLAVIALIGILAYQLFDLAHPSPSAVPPQRELLGHAIVADNCWSSALGGLWRPEDDLKYIFDSTWEQIAYGTFPWGVLAPIAIYGLMASSQRKRAGLGALALAWAGGAWAASEVFQRKVGFTLYAGFPAMALAVGVWLDDVLAARARADRPVARSAPMLLVGLYVVLAVVDLAKDMQSFGDRLPSILVGSEGVPYPPQSHVLFVPTKLWLLVLGGGLALAFALAAAAPRRRIAGVATALTLAGTVAFAAFWPFAWQPALG
ncbi:MAG TPA: hypothetical protein VLX92_13430, partial [Kofleriaceae bacterium]|nr:hypothetical protein [Kofleriaceae bacterium]